MIASKNSTLSLISLPVNSTSGSAASNSGVSRNKLTSSSSVTVSCQLLGKVEIRCSVSSISSSIPGDSYLGTKLVLATGVQGLLTVSSNVLITLFGFLGALCLLGSLSNGGTITESLEFLVVLCFVFFGASIGIASDDGEAYDFFESAVLTVPTVALFIFLYFYV